MNKMMLAGSFLLMAFMLGTPNLHAQQQQVQPQHGAKMHHGQGMNCCMMNQGKEGMKCPMMGQNDVASSEQDGGASKDQANPSNKTSN